MQGKMKEIVYFIYLLLSTFLVWAGVIAVGVFLIWLCGEEQFLLRTVLIFPFTMVGVYKTIDIWRNW